MCTIACASVQVDMEVPSLGGRSPSDVRLVLAAISMSSVRSNITSHRDLLPFDPAESAGQYAPTVVSMILRAVSALTGHYGSRGLALGLMWRPEVQFFGWPQPTITAGHAPRVHRFLRCGSETTMSAVHEVRYPLLPNNHNHSKDGFT